MAVNHEAPNLNDQATIRNYEVEPRPDNGAPSVGMASVDEAFPVEVRQAALPRIQAGIDFQNMVNSLPENPTTPNPDEITTEVELADARPLWEAEERARDEQLYAEAAQANPVELDRNSRDDYQVATNHLVNLMVDARRRGDNDAVGRIQAGLDRVVGDRAAQDEALLAANPDRARLHDGTPEERLAERQAHYRSVAARRVDHLLRSLTRME